jgi:hypothetical protein
MFMPCGRSICNLPSAAAELADDLEIGPAQNQTL